MTRPDARPQGDPGKPFRAFARNSYHEPGRGGAADLTESYSECVY